MTLKVHLTELAFGGDAVGRLPDGKVVFVPLGAPGDHVSLRLTRQKKSMAWGEIVEVLEPGPGRRPPPCPLFGRCGGCAWQHLSYPQQLEHKEQMLRGILSRLDADLERLVPSPAELGYRRRARLHFSGDGVGFYRHRSREVQALETCPLLTAGLNRALPGLSGQGTVVLVEGEDGMVSVSLRGGEPAARVKLAPDVQGSAACFCQANAAQEAAMGALVADMSPPGTGEVLELYAGVGALTVALAPLCRQLTAVESWPASVELLRENCPDVEALTMTAEQALARGGKYDLVILDPPREGAKGLAPALAATGAATIIYVSCDPMTLQRDARELQAEGFRISRTVALDMMPQTHHAEVVMVLER